ncbi:phage head completion protein [Aliidiomarina sp. Khilg15.8]
MAIESGKLRHRIKLYRLVEQRAPSGEVMDENFVYWRSAWAEIMTAKRSEKVMSNGREMPFDKTFHTRFIPGTDENKSLAIEFNNRRYRVQEIENPEFKNIELFFGTEHIR